MKIYLLLSFLLTGSFIYAQAPEDALRYSFIPQNGTARNLAIGGAMGSLGGDINATFVNPAGLGFYKTGELVLSHGFILNNNRANFRGTDSKGSRNVYGFGASGFIFGAANPRNTAKSSALSFAITQTANFNNRIQYRGLNNLSSFSEQFAEEFAKSGLSIDEVLTSNSPLPYTSAPALYTYLVDTVTVNGVVKVKGAPEYILDAGQALQQEMTRITKGGITELAIGFAHNSNDKWYWGFSIAIPLINYYSVTNFKESDTSSSTTNHFKQFQYYDEFISKGVGANAKFGIIYKPKDFIRLGLAIHTPTYMSLEEKHIAGLSTELENPVNQFSVSSYLFTNGEPGKSNYSQTTPFKAILSASLIFREIENVKKQRGFLTADVEYVHHKGSRFGNDNNNVSEQQKVYNKALNNVIKREYKGNFNFRVGGELKFNVIMARLGFAYYGNPYKDAALKASRMLLSGGLGYRNKGFFVDLTYVHCISKDVSFPYRLEDRPNTYATLNQQRGNIMATVGFKF